jgi:hypothetical protein
MPKKTGGSGDADVVVESGAVPPAPRAAGSAIAFPSAEDNEAAAANPAPKAPTFAPPRPLSEVSFDEAKPSASTFAAPKPMSETTFDEAPDTIPRPAAPPMPGFQGGLGGPLSAPQLSASGMGISITGGPGMSAPPRQTPAQMSAGNQSLRIRLLRPDGKPFDGPEITTGPKDSDGPQSASRTEFDAPRGPKKQAPKVVPKTGAIERAGHTLAVLLISAIGVVPLGYLLMKSVRDREDKLAETITVPTKMNVLDTTSEAYLGGMVAVLLVVTVLYATRLRRRRAR